MFICETGCKSEFELDGDDDEIMCPHCGTMGNSPL
jgi:DNA-directed RNA polymerase subunit RPC12/RpoP